MRLLGVIANEYCGVDIVLVDFAWVLPKLFVGHQAVLQIIRQEAIVRIVVHLGHVVRWAATIRICDDSTLQSMSIGLIDPGQMFRMKSWPDAARLGYVDALTFLQHVRSRKGLSTAFLRLESVEIDLGILFWICLARDAVHPGSEG